MSDKECRGCMFSREVKNFEYSNPSEEPLECFRFPPVHLIPVGGNADSIYPHVTYSQACAEFKSKEVSDEQG